VLIQDCPQPDHLERLEAESLHILREVFACTAHPVLLYSIGKDSSVLLHLARKAFYPAALPLPLLHIDTGWKFKEMIAFRDQVASQFQLDLRVYTNPQGLQQDIVPFGATASHYTDQMKTQALKQALEQFGFTVAIGGARRDEEKSRAKERICSFRDAKHRWDPKNQRPELWNLYNLAINPGDNMRVFPLSNWTELDIWRYIERENIPVVPLYFAQHRPVIQRNGTWLMVDDDRLPIAPQEQIETRMIRFRTLGCYPLTGAIESQAQTVQEIISEMQTTQVSERQGRLIDHDGSASMEMKKRSGYF